MPKKVAIKVYHGFGHMHDLTVFGHVFRKNAKIRTHYTRNPVRNFFRLLRLFFLKPVPDVSLSLKWEGQLVKAHSEYDGFFHAEWSSHKETDAGWHAVKVFCDSTDVMPCDPGEGSIFIPHITQFGFISDIDDTI